MFLLMSTVSAVALDICTLYRCTLDMFMHEHRTCVYTGHVLHRRCVYAPCNRKVCACQTGVCTPGSCVYTGLTFVHRACCAHQTGVCKPGP